jgi:hypothetical protein
MKVGTWTCRIARGHKAARRRFYLGQPRCDTPEDLGSGGPVLHGNFEISELNSEISLFPGPGDSERDGVRWAPTHYFFSGITPQLLLVNSRTVKHQMMTFLRFR